MQHFENSTAGSKYNYAENSKAKKISTFSFDRDGFCLDCHSEQRGTMYILITVSRFFVPNTEPSY